MKKEQEDAPQGEEKPAGRPADDPGPESPGPDTDEEVEESSEDSFPASDPPAW